ncbi:MAG: ATP-binding protein [Deltaproteobacteria bacterium]|nr:ATP-binding protein [Deltaproteobacteria bacterium]
MIERDLSAYAGSVFQQYPVLTITGPRQSGKTTLARAVFPDLPYQNLEDLGTRELASSDPIGFMANLENGAVIDEIQRVPDLLSQIQVRVDAAGKNGMFVLTGSSQLSLMEAVSQSLAGRTALLKLLPFSVSETKTIGGDTAPDELMYKGFYPRIYDQQLDPTVTIGDYIETYVERDLRSFAQIRNLNLFRRFVRLCAGRVGQLLNTTNLASDVGVSKTTVSNWISILEASYLVFVLNPYHANIRKRLVKSPKLYFYDVGLATYLLGIENSTQIATHPLRGNLFENLVLIELLKHRFNRGKRANFSFYRDSGGNEVDVLMEVGGEIVPVEIKSGQTITGESFKGFRTLAKVLQKKMGRPLLVYTGDRNEDRSDAIVTNIQKLETQLVGLGV